MAYPRIIHFGTGLLLLLAGCRSARSLYDPEFVQVLRDSDQSWQSVDPVTPALPPADPVFQGPQPVSALIAMALDRNPNVQAARKRLESLALKVPAAASLQDPNLAMTFFPAAVETAAGAQEFAMGVNQKFPWFRKLDTRAGIAESEANVARARLAEVELETIAGVKQAYYELYYLQQAIKTTRTEQQLLAELRDVANARYQAGQVSQQDVLRADLEISQIESELIRLDQELVSAQARLAQWLHIDPSTKLSADLREAMNRVPDDLAWLQRRAVAARPALHAQLAALERDRQAVGLAQLDYYPDVTLGLNWIEVGNRGISPVTNGRDSLLLTAGLNLPIYRKRLRANVRSAEAKAVETARQYDRIRDETLQGVVDLFATARSQQDLLELFRTDILPKARQTLEVSTRAYNVGEVDFLQLIDNWRKLLRYEVTYYRLEASLQQTMAQLERLIGGWGGGPAGPQPAAPDNQ